MVSVRGLGLLIPKSSSHNLMEALRRFVSGVSSHRQISVDGFSIDRYLSMRKRMVHSSTGRHLALLHSALHGSAVSAGPPARGAISWAGSRVSDHYF